MSTVQPNKLLKRDIETSVSHLNCNKTIQKHILNISRCLTLVESDEMLENTWQHTHDNDCTCMLSDR